MKQEELSGFRESAQSLKLYRRADLQDQVSNKSIIKDLYVDPLPAEQVFNTILKENTTFLVGRKGTGKSTLFQRLQYELRKKPGYASAYIDIKTTYEESTTDPKLVEQLGNDALPAEVLQTLLLYRSFIKAVITAIRDQVEIKLRESTPEWLKDLFTESSDTLFESVNCLLKKADEIDLHNITGIRRLTLEDRTQKKQGSETTASLEMSLSDKPGLRSEIGQKNTGEVTVGTDIKYADILMRVFNIKDVLLQLKGILNKAGVRHLYVLIDDFSELPEDAMKIVVDALLAPLNNWSEELIKFKIAAYPHRVHYGQIDRTKIDEIYLDIYRLYGSNDVAGMEEKAIDFTRAASSQQGSSTTLSAILVFSSTMTRRSGDNSSTHQQATRESSDTFCTMRASHTSSTGIKSGLEPFATVPASTTPNKWSRIFVWVSSSTRVSTSGRQFTVSKNSSKQWLFVRGSCEDTIPPSCETFTEHHRLATFTWR